MTTRGSPTAAVVRFPDEVLKHLLSHFKIAITPSRIGRMATMFPGAAQHLLRVLADGLDLICHLINSDDRGFAQHNATPFCVNERVSGSEVDGQIVGAESGEQGKDIFSPQLLVVLAGQVFAGITKTNII